MKVENRSSHVLIGWNECYSPAGTESIQSVWVALASTTPVSNIRIQQQQTLTGSFGLITLFYTHACRMLCILEYINTFVGCFYHTAY